MWPHLVTLALGIWLMAGPSALAYVGAARTSHQIVGPVIATLAWVAAAECTRSVRLANVPLGAWLVVAPLLLDHPARAAMNSVLVGFAVVAFSLGRGRVRTRFGGGWRSLWQRPAGRT
jgi:hypothetical protein